MALIFTVFLPGMSFGQTRPDSITKWEVGFDLRSPFFKDPYDILRTTYGLIIKKQVKPDRALRFRTHFGLDYNEEILVKAVSPYSYTVSADVGYEKQKRVKKLVTYWGGEANVRYVVGNTWIGLEGRDRTNFSDILHDNARTRYLGVSLFAGGKYFFTRHVSLALESAFAVRHQVQVHYVQRYNQNNRPNGNPVRSIYGNGIIASIIPFSAFYINFHY